MIPCIPQQNDNATCLPKNRVGSGCRPNHISPAGIMPAHHHIVSGLALAACRRGVVWSRRCRAHVSVGGLLTTTVGRRQFTSRSWVRSMRGRAQAGAGMPVREVTP